MAEAWPLYVNMTVGTINVWLGLLLGFRLLNESIRHRDAFFIGVLSSLANHCVRHLGVIFGIHSLVTLAVVIVLCVLITHKNFWKSAAASAIGFAIICTVESLQLNIGILVSADYFRIINSYPWINILSAIPIDLLMLLMLYLSKKHKLVLFNSAYFET